MYTPYFVSLVNLYLRFFIINLFPDMILTSSKMNQDWVHRQDSLQTHIWRQFTDKTVHRRSFEDSSPTELKTVQRQNWRQFTKIFYIVFIMNVTCFTIIWDTIKHMTNIELLKLNDFCGTSIFLLDISMPNAYIYRSLQYLYIPDWS